MEKKTRPLKEPTLAQLAAQKQVENDVAVASQMKNSVAGDIWNEIKDLNIDMFALPSQSVQMHCHPVNIEPSKLYLVMNSSSVVAALESAIGEKYQVDLNDKFVVVSRATK